MTLDMNLVVNQIAKKTESEINASGALKDAAKKIFRGTSSISGTARPARSETA